MKIAILPIGPVDADVLGRLQGGLCSVFPDTTCLVLKGTMLMPHGAYNVARGQYHSSRILAKIPNYVRGPAADSILGVTEADLYVPRLNFVFGEAQYPGRVAIISLCRLKPEFYGQPPKRELLTKRSIKEAVHEIGHAAIGLTHCPNPKCVMCFSNSILMVDAKERNFCPRCFRQVLSVLQC